MSVYKTAKSPFWQFDFWIDGHRFSGSTKKTSRSRALKVEDRRKTAARIALEQGRNSLSARRAPMNLDAATSRYFTDKVEGTARWKETDKQMETLLDHLGDDTWLHDIDTDKVSRFVNARKVELKRSGRGRGADPVSPATVNRETQLLRRILRRARSVWKVRLHDDDIDWKEVLLEEPEGRVRELGDSEQAAILKDIREDLVAPLLFSLITGLRQMAVLRLTWSQVDFREKVVRVRLKSKKPGGRLLTVPLTDEAIVILANVRDHDERWVFTYVCRKSRGQRRKDQRYPFSRSGWRADWKAALTDAGVEDFVWHDLRHTSATRTLRVSNLAVVQRLLGHRSITSTMRYAHATVDDVRLAMDALEEKQGAQSRENPRKSTA